MSNLMLDAGLQNGPFGGVPPPQQRKRETMQRRHDTAGRERVPLGVPAGGSRISAHRHTSNSPSSKHSLPFHSSTMVASSAVPMRPFFTGVAMSSADRRKAFQTARFYSECSMRGIAPNEADKAAEKVRQQYGKWWTKPSVRDKGGEGDKEPAEEPSAKRMRIEPSTIQNHESQGINVTKHVSIPNELLSVASTFERPFYGSPTMKVEKRLRESTEHPHNDSSMHEDFGDEESVKPAPHRSLTSTAQDIHSVKSGLVQELQDSGGDTTSKRFLHLLDVLHECYKSQNYDARWTHTDPYCAMDGIWLTISRPTYSECLGTNVDGDYMYTLGRLAFDMFRPTGLRCSLQGVFQQMGLDQDGDGHDVVARHHHHQDRPRIFPSRLLRERQARAGAPPLRTNDIVISFTIEPGQTRRGDQREVFSDSNTKPSTNDKDYIVPRPIQALMTNHGYSLPDPNVPNRLSVWFCGGRLEPAFDDDEESDESDMNNNEEPQQSSSSESENESSPPVSSASVDLQEWQRLFDESAVPNRNFQELARVLAARCFLGAHLPEDMKADGSMAYSLQRPIGGHGQVYVDVLYCDETMRIIEGHHGSIFVSIRPLGMEPEVE